MSSYLAYSYSACLTEKKQAEIDKKVKESQEEFSRGFRRGTQISLSLYALYLLTTSTAYASESCPNPNQIAPTENKKAIELLPSNKPGFKPLSEATKGTFVGGASAICGAALQSGDFFLGVACATLLVIGGIIINRTPHPHPHN